MSASDLAEIARKVRAGERLSFEDGLCLAGTRDVHALGELADGVRERLHGRRTYYNINRHIHYGNYCVLQCRFCPFGRPYPRGGPRPGAYPGDAELCGDAGGGYELTVEQIVRRARQAANAGATEVHIVGGLHPKLPFEYYLEVCRGIRSACPELHIKAFTAVEILHFSRIARPRLTVRAVLEQLREAGLGSLPGGGAEIFDERVHDEAFKGKVGQAGWFDVHRTAHEMGLFSNATMLYGHVEHPQERVAHLLKLREHQDGALARAAAHFQCVVPLPFVPRGSRLAHLPGPSGLDDLRTIALARLLLDNVPHVKAFWVMLTPKLAQVSLNWGADDLDGTVVEYGITEREPGEADRGLTVEEIRALIREAGGVPVERDTLYRPVSRAAGR